MSSEKVATPPVVTHVETAASSSSSVWDRFSKWASENKALVYTVAGIAVVVTSAGVVYYLSDTGKPAPSAASAEKRKSKKERRKEKRKAEQEKKTETSATNKQGMFEICVALGCRQVPVHTG